ncbi:uncharacterized protein LOC131893315 [Tigriopus californicus]|uniref:uncharacterized protein LOC131893315 n=1 Tax=Tigriopus californicus TaxID=6832 RepID=UPI0027DA51BC|nr:uncharacterized protein LOC131893315 [Tigriopus californicus]
MHKHAKKYLDLKVRLIDSQESTFHLLLKYCPQVPPKFILKRKDVDKDVVNAKDNLGTSALMKALWDKRSSTVEKILASKNIRENKLLDLQEVDKTGRSILHLLIDNNDLVNFQSLVDRDELTKEIANRPNPQGQTPISLCLKKKLVPFLEAIFDSSTGINKFHINVVQDGSSVIHVVATIGSLNLWLRALAKCDVNTIDELGNTALMKAAQCGHDYLVDSALQIAGDRINPEMRNKDGNTLLLMAIQNFDIDIVKALIQGRDHKKAINLANNESMSPLVLAASLNKWALMRFLLESDHLKDEKGNGVVDVHVKDKAGQTPLVLVLLTRIKLHRMEQSFLMKGEKETAKDIRLEFDNLWEIVKLILEREKEIHGPTMMQGRDGGSETLKKQMNVNKTIQISIQQDVCREYARLFTTIKPKKSLAKQISTGKLDQPNAAEDRKVSLKPVFRQNPLITRDDIKGNDLQKGKEKKEVPTISLDDLRSPDGLQDVVNKITKKMDEEKSKIVKNKKKLGSIGKNDLPDSTTAPECKENENYLKVNANAGENGSDASREWSPTPVPRMRRTSSFRKKPMHVEDMKPPIPSGPSPPPPPEPDNPNESKFKFPDPKPNATPKRNDVKSFVEDSKSLINLPMGLDSKDLKKSRSGNALNRKQTKSMVEPLANGREEESKTGVDLTVFQKKPAKISTISGVETREAFTQTDNLMEPKTLGVQACCCQCHETKPRPKSNEIGKNNNAFRRYSKL